MPPLPLLLALALAGCASNPPEPPHTAAVPAHAIADPARGELLYRTTCQGCHDRETHWRNRHWVRDWPTLVQQVTRWQGIAGQTWSVDEIEDVSAYLNRLFYEVPCPLPRCAAGTVG
ncbi:MAG TPA: cytochrome c [Burkholderiales bacterium]|nr:cytochrome c [Burkholderiales bacterium]